ncbi:ABC transporter substrate-binding protein [Treponema parvum]|uniref:ABC transporter substrate-binding protein n=1 Tax=Treponema parvum TaxID=138851 RepID=UPI001AEBAB49|nr:ABC transporter substrate-binding protein [Treponema parvum]QTQ16818.1 ABC transporter substrate-binding protein [Treponema parvum]
MKKSLFRILAVFLLVTALGCSKKEKTAQATTRTVVDHNGDTIVLPAKIERVVIASLIPLPSVYCLYRGGTQNLVGIPPASMSAAVNSQLVKIYPEIAKMDTSFVQNGSVNIEQLMSLKPDVILFSATNAKEREMFKTSGIPAVGFSFAQFDFDAIAIYESWIKLLGEIFGDTGRADKMLAYSHSVEKFVKERVEKIPEDKKPRCLVFYACDDRGMRVSGSKMFGQYWIETVGGINAASELKGTASVNMEQIYDWNPDKVFLNNFCASLPEDLYNNAFKNQDWSSVKAVQTRQVYKYPLGMYRWCPPGPDIPLSLLWCAKQIQPEVFSDVDMDKEIKTYFKNMYGVELSDKDLSEIYNPPREAAIY